MLEYIIFQSSGFWLHIRWASLNYDEDRSFYRQFARGHFRIKHTLIDQIEEEFP